MSDRSKLSELAEPKHHRAEIVYGAVAFLIAVFLAFSIPSQTQWVDRLDFVKQPAFWPIVSIAGMCLFGVFELFFAWRRNASGRGASIPGEIFHWVRAAEYAVWFMVYVFLVPITGYLPTTLVFCVALVIRLGYRERKHIFAALLTGFLTVVVFKSLLSVKIPGAAVYEYLPKAARNFLTLYF